MYSDVLYANAHTVGVAAYPVIVGNTDAPCSRYTWGMLVFDSGRAVLSCLQDSSSMQGTKARLEGDHVGELRKQWSRGNVRIWPS